MWRKIIIKMKPYLANCIRRRCLYRKKIRNKFNFYEDEAHPIGRHTSKQKMKNNIEQELEKYCDLPTAYICTYNFKLKPAICLTCKYYLDAKSIIKNHSRIYNPSPVE